MGPTIETVLLPPLSRPFFSPHVQFLPPGVFHLTCRAVEVFYFQILPIPPCSPPPSLPLHADRGFCIPLLVQAIDPDFGPFYGGLSCGPRFFSLIFIRTCFLSSPCHIPPSFFCCGSESLLRVRCDTDLLQLRCPVNFSRLFFPQFSSFFRHPLDPVLSVRGDSRRFSSHNPRLAKGAEEFFFRLFPYPPTAFLLLSHRSLHST